MNFWQILYFIWMDFMLLGIGFYVGRTVERKICDKVYRAAFEFWLDDFMRRKSLL